MAMFPSVRVRSTVTESIRVALVRGSLGTPAALLRCGYRRTTILIRHEAMSD